MEVSPLSSLHCLCAPKPACQCCTVCTELVQHPLLTVPHQSLTLYLHTMELCFPCTHTVFSGTVICMETLHHLWQMYRYIMFLYKLAPCYMFGVSEILDPGVFCLNNLFSIMFFLFLICCFPLKCSFTHVLVLSLGYCTHVFTHWSKLMYGLAELFYLLCARIIYSTDL